MLKLFFIFLTFGIVLSDDPYIPCQSYISFSYDDSGSISYTNFKTQMNFIKNAIGALNYPNRLRAEGGYGSEYNWKTGLNIQQMQSAIDAAEQTTLPYSLSKQFSSLVTSFEALKNYSSNFGAIIFISDTSDHADLTSAYRILPKLKGIHLSQPAPDNWDLLSYHAYGCDTSGSTKPVPTGPTTTPIPYYPCQNWIEILAGDSIVLTADQFQAQVKFIKTISAQMTHLERIQYGAHNLTRGLILYPWNPYNNQNGLQQAVENSNQTNSESSILEAFKFLSSIDSGIFNTTVLIGKAFRIYNTFIKIHGIQLTLILAGKRTSKYAVRAFEDDAIIYKWQNIGVTAQPDEWDMSVAFRCTPPPPKPSESPYLPCESWIHFGIDDSNTLEKNEFYTETSFISSTIGNINFPKRIVAVGMYFQPVFWNNFDTVDGIQESVDYFPKGDGPYSLKQQFIALSANLQNTETGNIQIAALIYISDTSDSALAGADQIFNQFKPVKITFVLLGNKTDSSKLTKYSSNFVSWNIYHNDQPDNWNNLYYSVYGCQ